MEVLQIVGIVILVIVVLVVLAFAVINFDLISYTATASETLNATGASIGRALVVYSPGLSGAAKQAATIVADNLQAKNYTVVLAGVRSRIASNMSSYDIIIAGGPMYFGKVSSSIDEYLKTLPNNTKLGVFGTTGSSNYVESDFISLTEQVASDTHNEKAIIKFVLAGNESSDCADLVSTLLQQG
jgi:flavorubredoxin